jgi:hypothetical protein
MASIRDSQIEAMASIDTAKAMVDKVLTIMGILTATPSLSLTFATNPIGFLLQMLKHVGVTYEELRDWLANFLVFVIPVMEVSVKAVLLTNLKNMVSCSIDPRIPDKYRKQCGRNGEPYVEDYGFNVNLESIDFFDKLSENPLSDYGKEVYFGLDGVEDVYKFARAEDFDAFLWFVMHRARFYNSSGVETEGGIIKNEGVFENMTIEPQDTSLLSVFKTYSPSDNPSNIMLGNTFKYKEEDKDISANTISMCIDRKYDSENNVVSNTMVPVSCDSLSANWYIRRANQLTKNLGIGKSKFETRDFSKERAICNLEFFDTATSNESLANGLVNNSFRLTILPKPKIHIPNVDKGEKPWGFRLFLFDENGEFDLNGKYTISQNIYPTYYGEGDSRYAEYELTKNDKIRINVRTGKVTVIGDIRKGLIECYKGLTVYEFNYDYVMGMKLFDAKVMATTLLDTLVNTRLGLKLDLVHQHQDATDEIKEIIKNIINSDDSTVEDCYFTFDNRKYDELLRKSEKRRARQYDFGNTNNTVGTFDNVAEILGEYDAEATLEGRVDILSRAITQATVNITEGLEESDKYGVEFGFVFDLIENLVFALVNAVLTPKVLMLLEVNRQLMGGNWKMFTIKDLLAAMRSIIISLVMEVRDLVIQELLKFIMKELMPLKEMMLSAIARERIENYTDAINEIIKNCPFLWFSLGGGAADQEVRLDTVDYADIDYSTTNKDEKPSNNC